MGTAWILDGLEVTIVGGRIAQPGSGAEDAERHPEQAAAAA